MTNETDMEPQVQTNVNRTPQEQLEDVRKCLEAMGLPVEMVDDYMGKAGKYFKSQETSTQEPVELQPAETKVMGIEPEAPTVENMSPEVQEATVQEAPEATAPEATVQEAPEATAPEFPVQEAPVQEAPETPAPEARRKNPFLDLFNSMMGNDGDDGDQMMALFINLVECFQEQLNMQKEVEELKKQLEEARKEAEALRAKDEPTAEQDLASISQEPTAGIEQTQTETGSTPLSPQETPTKAPASPDPTPTASVKIPDNALVNFALNDRGR